MSVYLPAFVGFLGALLFALAAGTWRPGPANSTARSVLAWAGVLGLAFATVVYLLALLGAVVFVP